MYEDIIYTRSKAAARECVLVMCNKRREKKRDIIVTTSVYFEDRVCVLALKGEKSSSSVGVCQKCGRTGIFRDATHKGSARLSVMMYG